MTRSDESLVIAARSGDSRAFDELVRRHYGPVFQRIARILGNRDDALEVAQDVFLKAYRSLDQIRDGTTVRAWLGTIGVRLAMNRAKRDRFRRLLKLEDEPEDRRNAPAVSDPFIDFVRARRVARIRKEIGRLTPAQRTAFQLRHFERMAFREVARWMGNSESTARVLYFQAVRRLRRTIEEES